MNVEIAQRLAGLRRDKGYSQEELAENLGLSRQAVSKWERAESSPDTGNLIALAKLYGVTLDDLLRVDADIEDDVKFEARDRAASTESEAQAAAEKARVAAVQAQAAAAQAQAVQVQTASAYHEVQANASSVAQTPQQAAEAPITSSQQPAPAQQPPHQQPMPTQIPYSQPHAQQGYAQHAQSQPQAPYGQAPASQTHQASAPIPAASVGPEAERKGPWLTFPYPILCVIMFLCLGFFWSAWHPAWVVFLTIPLYYWIAHIIENDPNYRK